MSRIRRLVVWAYRTPKCTSTQVKPFSLVYGVKGMIHIEVIVHLARLALRLRS